MPNRNYQDLGPVIAIATKKVKTAPPTMRIIGAIETLTEWGFRRLPIVDPGTERLLGILTARDVVDFLGGGERFNLINVKHAGNFLAAINESVNKIMETEVSTLTCESQITDALKIILRDRIGGIPIVDDEYVLCGIVTERDVLKVVCHSHEMMPVKEVMTKSLLVEDPDSPFSAVTKVMTDHQFRRLPIVKDDVLFGIITATDIVKYIGSGKVFERLVTGNVDDVMSVPVRELMSGMLYTIEPDVTVTDAARIMISKKVGALPVIENRKLIGLVTEFDLVRAFATENNKRKWTV